MASTRRAQKREQAAAHLTATAFRLFETYGYEAVTMERIAAEADVAKATLYKYFPVKEALLGYQFGEEIGAGMAALESSLKQQKTFAARMRILLEQSAKWHSSRRDYLAHYLRFRRSDAAHSPTEAQFNIYSRTTKRNLEALFRAAQQTGEIRKDYPPNRLAWMFEYLLVGAVTAWLNQPRGDLNREFQFALELLLEGIAAPPDSTRPPYGRR